MEVDENIVKALKIEFKGEAGKIISFLERGFSDSCAQVAIASIFSFAKDNGITVDRVLEECEKEWQDNWNFQHPDIRGSLSVPGAGAKSKRSIDNICRALGIPLPEEVLAKKLAKVPKGSIVVITENSTYRFGPEDKKGVRTVSRDEKPLKVKRCKILSLAVGEEMGFRYTANFWYPCTFWIDVEAEQHSID